MKKKRFLLLLLVTWFMTNAALADNEYLQYQYDAAGNRIGRVVVAQQLRRSPQRELPAVGTTVYPTITSDIVTISTAEDTDNASLRYILCSIDGSVLATGELTTQRYVLSLSEYASGIYLLIIESPSASETFKLIKK